MWKVTFNHFNLAIWLIDITKFYNRLIELNELCKHTAHVHTRKHNTQTGWTAMSRGIKSRLPFGVSARLDNQRDYIKAISHVTHDKVRVWRQMTYSLSKIRNQICRLNRWYARNNIFRISKSESESHSCFNYFQLYPTLNKLAWPGWLVRKQLSFVWSLNSKGKSFPLDLRAWVSTQEPPRMSRRSIILHVWPLRPLGYYRTLKKLRQKRPLVTYNWKVRIRTFSKIRK